MPILKYGFCGTTLKKASRIVFYISTVFSVLALLVSAIYLYFFLRHQFTMNTENPGNLLFESLISLLTSFLALHGVKQNDRFYMLPWLVWFSIVLVGFLSHIFVFMFASFMYGSSGWPFILITLLLVVLSGLLSWFLVIVVSFYQELRDQFVNQPEAEPQPFDKVPV